MRKVRAKISRLGLVLAFVTLTASCSKDDNDGYEQPIKGSIDVAIGTYKGKLYISPSQPNEIHEWYDAVVIVTKEGANKLKVVAKSGEAYSKVTPKVFTVETGAFFGENTQDIASLTGSVEGFFHYYGANKNISVTTNKQAATEIEFEFDGVKQ